MKQNDPSTAGSRLASVLALLKKEPMLAVSLAAAIIALILTPPTPALLGKIDWRTLGTLFLMLTILEGFKKENIFLPLLRRAGHFRYLVGLSLFLVFCVFFSSMFVTNDVSLIIFVPLTIILYRAGRREELILPLLAMENIAAVRGSLLTPFGSPQNLFIFGQSGVSAARFVQYMFPIWILSGILLVCFVLALHRKNLRELTAIPEDAFPAGKTGDSRKTGEGSLSSGDREPSSVSGKLVLSSPRAKKTFYLVLFAVVLWMIVSRTSLWVWVLVIISALVLAFDREVLRRTDYVLLLTFFCFFVFSSSVTNHPAIAGFLSSIMAGREYVVSILVSQVISNVPASIVLYPFAVNKGALLYGLDSAGLCTLIGSLASVINYRIYVRDYPSKGGEFIKVFTAVSLAFFALVAIPGYLISQTPL